jgi:hypothetical protein
VTVNVPEQAAPVINLTVPERPLPPLEPPPGEGARPSVTEYVIFEDMHASDNSTDTMPYEQQCASSLS